VRHPVTPHLTSPAVVLPIVTADESANPVDHCLMFIRLAADSGAARPVLPCDERNSAGAHHWVGQGDGDDTVAEPTLRVANAMTHAAVDRQ
jgi:hypothetical protein